MKLDLDSLRISVRSLDLALGVVEDVAWMSAQSSVVHHTLIAGVIQNFEFTYEVAIKFIRRQLELDADSPVPIDHLGFKDMLRMAGERGLIDEMEPWVTYRTLRNITPHTYDQKKADLVYERARPLLEDTRKLLKVLELRHG